MKRVITTKALEGYTLEIAFSDGTRGTVDLSARLFDRFFRLRDPAQFAQNFVDEFWSGLLAKRRRSRTGCSVSRDPGERRLTLIYGRRLNHRIGA